MTLRVFFLLLPAFAMVGAQSQPSPNAPIAISVQTLDITETIAPGTDMGTAIVGPFRCDSDGNVYLRLPSASVGPRAPIQKYDAKGTWKVAYAVSKTGIEN